MPKLKCGVETCSYFHDQFCIRDGIQVKGDTALEEHGTNCSSYRLKTRIATDRLYKMEIGTIASDLVNLDIKCEAVNCIFNRSLSCRAKDIKIDGTRARNKKETFCSSFRLK